MKFWEWIDDSGYNLFYSWLVIYSAVILFGGGAAFCAAHYLMDDNRYVLMVVGMASALYLIAVAAHAFLLGVEAILWFCFVKPQKEE